MNLSHRSPSLPLRLSLCAAALLAVSACDDNGSDVAAPDSSTTAAPSASSSPSDSVAASPSDSASASASASASETPSATGTPTDAPTATDSPQPRLLAYAGGESYGVRVRKPSDVRKLDGAPQDFRDFIARTAEKVLKASTCSDKTAVGVTVEFMRTDGYAVGGVNDCGGYAAMWAVVDGQWKEIQGTQDSWDCRILKRYRVPSDIAGESCYDYQAQKGHHYHQA